MGKMTEKRRATNICKILQDKGFEAVFAGGCVRDIIMNIEPKDYDVATNATPDEIKANFTISKFVGESFGVSLVNGIEVATFRTDGEYSDGRRPDSVKFCSMEEDAKRRDLTINAIFFDPITEKHIDFVGGLQDIAQRIIRFVGDPIDRINEDALRLLRAVRFMTKYNLYFSSDEQFDKMEALAWKVSTLSEERILEELKKGLSLKNSKKYINNLLEFGILDWILPEVSNLFLNEQDPIWHPEGDVLTHTLLALSSLPEEVDWRVKFAVLIHDIGKPATQTFEEERIRNHRHSNVGADMAEVLCERLRMSNEDTKHIVSLVRDHMKFKDIKSITGYDHNMDILEYAKEQFENYKPEDDKPMLPEPLVNGNDLIMMGLKPGPKFKEILDIMMDKQLEGEINGRIEALEILQMISPILAGEVV